MAKRNNRKAKGLYKIVVTELCRYGDKPIIYWTWAYSRSQAKLQAQRRFNREHHRKKNVYVEMYIDLILDKKTSRS